METPEGKRALGRTRRRWEDNTETNLKERGRKGVNWISLVQDGNKCRAFADTLVNLRAP
jgi:hypothetical protein